MVTHAQAYVVKHAQAYVVTHAQAYVRIAKTMHIMSHLLIVDNLTYLGA